MAIVLSDNVQTNAPKPSDSRYLNNLVPYSSTTEATTTIVEGVRYSGLTVNVGGVEYWWKDGIGDGDLVLKTTGGGGSATSGENVTKNVTQASHGFAVKDFIGWSGGTYNKAIADGNYDGEFVGLVTSASTNSFNVTQSGYVTGLTGLVTNTTYFLSESTAGLITDTAPTGDTQINKAVLVANSTTSGWVLPYAGVVISSGNSGGGGDLSWDGTTTNALGTYVDEFTICAQENLTFDGQNLLVVGTANDDDIEIRARNLVTTGNTRGTVLAQTCDGGLMGMFAYGSGHSASVFGEPMSGSTLLWAQANKLMIGTNDSDAPVKIYHAGSEKLSTTSDGIDISGKTCAYGGIDVGSTSFVSGDTFLRFAGDRPWLFCQDGDDAGANLRLIADANSKSFDITDCLGYKMATFRADSGLGSYARLYFSGETRLETQTNGVNIVGTLCTDTLQVSTGAASGCVLTSDGSGNATWETPSGGGGIAMSGSTVNGLTTYVDANTICAEPNIKASQYCLYVGSDATTQSTAMMLGDARTDSGYAYIDFVGDTTYSDYGLRVLRSNGGENTNSIICHRGTGNLLISTVDTAPICLCTPGAAVRGDCLRFSEGGTECYDANTDVVKIETHSDKRGLIIYGHTGNTGTNYAAIIYNKGGTSSGGNYGLMVDASYAGSPSINGRSHGIVGFAGNKTSRYNYGVIGMLCGTNDGAGIVGTTAAIWTSILEPGCWAVYSDGPLYSCGAVTAKSSITAGGIIETTSSSLQAVRIACGTYYSAYDYNGNINRMLGMNSTQNHGLIGSVENTTASMCWYLGGGYKHEFCADGDVDFCGDVTVCGNSASALNLYSPDNLNPFISFYCTTGPTRIGYIRGCGSSTCMAACLDAGTYWRLTTTSFQSPIVCGLTCVDSNCHWGTTGAGSAIMCACNTFQTTSGLAGIAGYTQTAGYGYLGHYNGSIRTGVFGGCCTYSDGSTNHAGYFAGCVCINDTQASGYALKIDTCGCAVDFVATSDCRKKKNITPIANALSTVDCLCGRCYNFCDEEETPDMGLIAQDVYEIEPRLVTIATPSPEEKEKYGISDQVYGLKYDKFAGLFVEAIKELKAQNECLQLQINELRKNK